MDEANTEEQVVTKSKTTIRERKILFLLKVIAMMLGSAVAVE